MLPPDKDELSGHYLYSLDGRPTSIVESFRVRRKEGKLLQINGHRSVPDGPRLEVSAVMRDGLLRKAEFKWSAPDRKFDCEYECQENFWHVEEKRTEFTADILLFGLLRVFTGQLLLSINRIGGKARVLTPSLEAGGMLFQPLVSTRTVQLVEEKESAGAQCFTYRGGPYGGPSRCWIGPGGLLSRYNWVEEGKGVWEVSMISSGVP